jgi:hypothetical protein
LTLTLEPHLFRLWCSWHRNEGKTAVSAKLN